MNKPTQTSLLPIKKMQVPDWVPPQFQEELQGRKVELARLPLPIRRRMRTPEKIKVSEHAVKFRWVADGDHVGPWRNEYVPHGVKIMDTFGLPWVREVWFCGVDQSGKTNLMLNCLNWCIDISPGDVYFMAPTEKKTVRMVRGKIIPMLQKSSSSSKYISKRKDDTGQGEIRLRHGVVIRPAWANSADSTSSFSAKYSFGDEVDKYGEVVGTETNAINNIRKRNRTFKGRYKRMFVSTPAGRFIYSHTMDCPQVWAVRVLCPHCQELIKMDGEHLALDKKVPAGEKEARLTVADIEGGTEVKYICNSCGAMWDEMERMLAIRHGRWVCIKGADILRPTRVGFHHRAWECGDVSLAEIAVAWLKAEDGTVADKKDWAHGYEAIDYKHEPQDRKEDFILRLRDESMPRGLVPGNTQLLLVLADTQRAGFHYEVMAFGWGEFLPIHVVDHGFVETFQTLNDIARKSYFDAEEREFRPFAGFIDSGGGTDPHRPKHTRTVQVYQFCRSNPFWKPLKGRRTMETSWNVRRQDFYPASVGKKVPIPGGLNLYTINVTMHKNELSSKLQIEPGDPGAFTLHADVTSDYARQMCAEYQDDRGYWICPDGRDNHHWDIGVYGIASGDILGLRNRRPKIVKGQETKRTIRRGGFVHNY